VPSLAPHIIRRQVWQLEVFGTEADGFALQRSMPDLCHGLAPALEPVLDRTVSAGEHMTIDRLEIDAGTLSLEHLERDLIGAVTEALEKRLREYGLTVGSTVSSSPIQRRTEAQTVQEAFLHFLKTGSLPWWFHLPADKTLEDIVQASWQARITAELPEHFSRGVIEALGFAFVGKRLVQQFSPAFLGRLTLVPYYPLGDAQIAAIVDLKLKKLAQRFSRNHKVGFAWDEEVAQAIAARCTEVESGARNVDHILSDAVLPELSRLVLEHLSMSAEFGDVHMVLDAHDNFAFHFRSVHPQEQR